MDEIYNVEPEVTGWLVFALGAGALWVLASALMGTLVFRVVKGVCRICKK